MAIYRNAYILENRLHHADCNFGLLDQVILGILDLEATLLLASGACRFEAKQAG